MSEGLQRKRGVRASRTKLSAALAAAGLKTQAALAERIADLEGLDTAPKDLVSRAFREQAVEPVSLERIANALDVPAHTLYQSSEDAPAVSATLDSTPEVTPDSTSDSSQHSTAGSSGQARRRGTLTAIGAAVGVAVVLGVSLAWWLWPQSAQTPAQPGLTQGAARVVLLPVDGAHGQAFAQSLQRQLSEHFKVSSPTADLLMGSTDVGEVSATLRADVVLSVQLMHERRMAGLAVFAFIDGVRQQIWAESYARAELPELLDEVAKRTVDALQQVAAQIAYFPRWPALEDYLAGEALLDLPANEINLKRAQSRFAAALQRDQNYAQAHAGLCESLLQQAWMYEEDRMLELAASACSQALRLDAQHPVVATAHAHYLSLTGRQESAVELYQDVMTKHPQHAMAAAGLSAVLLEQYRESLDTGVLSQAAAAARRAAEIEQSIWKPLFSLATILWFAGDMDGAIEASEQALGRDENEYILGNLGTFYMCRGDFEQAETAYLRAQEVGPQSYVGDEFLGTTYQFLGRYDEAVQLRQRAIRSIGEGAPEHHRMWGQLADSLFMLGTLDEAERAYERAAEIAERDYLQGRMPAFDRVARVFYYLRLAQLRDDELSSRRRASLEDELAALNEVALEAAGFRRLAQIHQMLGDREAMALALDKALAICPGYGSLPELMAHE